MFSRSASEVIGQSAAQIFSTRLDLVEHYRRVSHKHEEIVEGEGEAQHAFEVRASPLIDQRHQPMGHLVTLRDITQRNRMEKEVRESEERVRGLSDVTFEGIAIHDLREILDVNRAFAPMFGYEPAQAIGMHFRDWVAPESRDLIDRLVLSGSETPCEAVGLRLNDATFPVKISDKTIYYRARTARVMVIRDLTDQKRAEPTRYESEILARLRNALANSPDAVLVLDVATRKATFLNRDEFCGYAKSELAELGPVLNAIHPDDAGILRAHGHRFSTTTVDKIDPIESRIRKKTASGNRYKGERRF